MTAFCLIIEVSDSPHSSLILVDLVPTVLKSRNHGMLLKRVCAQAMNKLRTDWETNCLEGHVMAVVRVRTRLLEYRGFQEHDQLVPALVQAAHELSLPHLEKVPLQRQMTLAVRSRSQRIALCTFWWVLLAAARSWQQRHWFAAAFLGIWVILHMFPM